MSTRIAVFGTGYLGATHAACMAELGHEVLGVDVDAAKLEKLAAGEVPFYEPGLGEVLRNNIDRGRLKFTSSYEEAAEFADVFFLGVGTPQKKGEFAADMVYVDAVIETLAPLLTKPSVIFGKSTVPVGTAERLGKRARELAPIGDGVEVAWNPEFLREGFAVQDTFAPGPSCARSRSKCPWSSGSCCARSLCRAHRCGDSVSRHGPCDGGVGESVSERFPGHQDLVHQRHLRSVRGCGRRRHSARRRDRARRSDRTSIPQRGNWFRRRGVCRRTSVPSWLAPVNSVPTKH